ncbi:MAG: hypothetical protein PF444_09025, partial [Bacteroidales bacterium]|nr:hypothetical protein [Bacteroidales bacterium]
LYDWTAVHKTSPFSIGRNSIGLFTNIEALTALMKLLEISYNKSITDNYSFDSIDRYVLDAIEKVALHSEDNYKATVTRIEEFISFNVGKLKDVEFRNNFLLGLSGKFSEKTTTKYSLRKAKKLVDALID